VETALVASGLLGERYVFLGYLPRTPAALDRLWEESRAWTWPAVAFESPRRLPASLARLAAVDPDRPVAVCRELTKRFEEVVRGTAREVAERFSEAPKGEVTVVVGAAPESAGVDEAAAFEALEALLASGASRRGAADVVARLTGVPRNRLYRGSL
jgi:16S rRNA (cytidine1402-2'-O)-methyltransferase